MANGSFNVPPREVAFIAGFKPPDFCDVQKLCTALSVAHVNISSPKDRESKRVLRIHPHVHLHVDALFEIDHDSRDACL